MRLGISTKFTLLVVLMVLTTALSIGLLVHHNSSGMTNALVLIILLEVIAGGLAWVLAATITEPLRSITQAASRLAQGETVSLPVTAAGEIGELAQCLDRMASELAARQREEGIGWARLDAVIDNSSEAILSVNDQGRIMLFNTGAEIIFGYSAAEMLGEPLERLLPERFAAGHVAHMQRFAQETQMSRHMQSRNAVHGRRKDGSEFPAEATISKMPVDDTFMFTVILRDISERKQTENELQRLGRVLDNTVNEIYMFDAATLNFVQVNQGARRNLGYSMDELRRMTPLDLKPLYTRAEFDGLLAKLRESPDQRTVFQTLHRRKDGSLYPVEVRLQYSQNETVPVYVAIIEDTSERRKAEELQARLTAIIESSVDIIATADGDGNVLYLNLAGRRFMGLDESGIVVNLRIADFHPGWALSQAWHEAIPYAIRDGFWHGESELRNPAGQSIPVSQLILAHKDASGRLLYLSSVMRDISERKTAEQELRARQRDLEAAYEHLEAAQSQLLQSEKMASIGQLAAGVAHEINNPVGYISSNLNTLKGYVDNLVETLNIYEVSEASLAADPEVLKLIRAIKERVDLDFIREDTQNLIRESQEGVDRVKRIVADLKEFSRVDEMDWQWADLHKGLDSTLNVAHNEIKYKAEVIRQYGDIPRVECLASQINQVLMNLLVNAAHAIEERGTITVRTGREGDQVWIEVQDTGQGIPAENLKRIYDPFFTTKPVGKGTGLGLSLTYGIIQKHNGRIEVDSKVGKGTRFRVWLPIQRTPTDSGNASTSVNGVT